MAIDPRMLERAIPPGMTVSQVAPRFTDEQFAELREFQVKQHEDNLRAQEAAAIQAHDEKLRLEGKQDVLNDRQHRFTRAQIAFNALINPEFNGLCKAEAHAEKADLDLARDTRREALHVLKSYLTEKA